MNKLSKLELITAIPELKESYDLFQKMNLHLISADEIASIVIKNKAMLWDLRLKYKVEIDDECNTCRIWDLETEHNWTVDYETDEDLPRAMLEVILEANNGN